MPVVKPPSSHVPVVKPTSHADVPVVGPSNTLNVIPPWRQDRVVRQRTPATSAEDTRQAQAASWSEEEEDEEVTEKEVEPQAVQMALPVGSAAVEEEDEAEVEAMAEEPQAVQMALPVGSAAVEEEDEAEVEARADEAQPPQGFEVKKEAKATASKSKARRVEFKTTPLYTPVNI